MSTKYDLDICKQVIDVVLKNLATTLLKTETLTSAPLTYIQEPQLQEVANKLRSEIKLPQAWDVIDKRALEAELEPLGVSSSHSSDRMKLLQDDTNSLEAKVTKLQNEVTDVHSVTNAKQMLIKRLET